MKTTRWILTVALLGLFGSMVAAASPAPAFTYQGRLNQQGIPANGLYDFTFQAFLAPVGDVDPSDVITNLAVEVNNGLFRALVDVGAPDARFDAWLEIGVRRNGQSTGFTLLSPRQSITPAPFALYADQAGQATNALSVASGVVTGEGVALAAISGAHLADDQVVRSLNDLQDVVRLVAGTNVSIAVSGNDLQISATPGTSVTGAGWSLTGNAGTGTGSFLGTLDDQPLEFRVNNGPALRLESTAGTPNLVGGWIGNVAAPGVQGATIGGGGARMTLSVPNHQEVAAAFGTIGGGARNHVDALYGGIGGGYFNTIESEAVYATVAGGLANRIGVYAEHATIGGGRWNQVGTGADGAMIAGGSSNVVSGSFSSIGGGEENKAVTGSWTTIAGGRTNTASAAYASVLGGANNVAGGGSSMVGGGVANQATESHSAVVGGFRNEATGQRAAVGGGRYNQASGIDSTVSGGQYNTASGDWAAVAGGSDNQATNSSATIGGGHGNIAGAASATVAGGSGNSARGVMSAVGGGDRNAATDAYGTVGGGLQNTAGYLGTVPGGRLNTAAAPYSFAAGRRARALHEGAFVWGDSLDADVASVATNEFVVRATGGVRIDSPTGIGLNAADRPMITRGFDPFAATAGDKAGLGRWGLFMEPYQLVMGIPAEDIGWRTFAVAKYQTDGTRESLITVTQEGDLSCNSLTILGGADLAEPFPMSDGDLPQGSLVIIDEEKVGHLKLSHRAYDRRIAGVVSGAQGIRPGLTLRQADRLGDGQPVALGGRVYALADAALAPIQPGDLLTTSDTPGHAMKVSDHARAQGAVLGKAMSPLTEGCGLVLVLVNLQ